MRSAEETRHIWKRAENILENYTPEQTWERDLWKMPKSFLKSITFRNAVDLLLEFRDSNWKRVDFRHLADRPERDGGLRKRVRERTWEVSTRVTKSNGWRTGKQTEGYVKKDCMGKSSHLPTTEASSLRSVDSYRRRYQEFSNFKGRYTVRHRVSREKNDWSIVVEWWDSEQNKISVFISVSHYIETM